MADPNALPLRPAPRRRAIVKRPPRAEDPPIGRLREEPELDLQKWRTIGENEKDQMIAFIKRETTFGSLKPRASWVLGVIKTQRKIANLARTRAWKKACEDRMVRIDDKSWELSGRTEDASEFSVFTQRFFHHHAKNETAQDSRRTALAQLLEQNVSPSNQPQRVLMTQELEKNKPTLLNYNGEWGLIPKGSISNFEELEGPDAVAQALRTQGSSHVRDLKLNVNNVIQSILAKDP